jgi:hypothetical protein
MSTGRRTREARRLSRGRKLLFAFVPLLALTLVAEIGIRLGRGSLYFGSFRDLRLDLFKRNYPAEPDPLLGYAPRPNFASTDNHWGTRVSIDADGMRRNGDAAPPEGPLVAAVGDSFTFGDQVDDDASWPAWLQRELGRPVKNGGVFGYSLTQAVLRAEAMCEKWPVADLVVSFIAGDLERCEYEKRYTPVPWFDIVDGQLQLENVPVRHDAEPDSAAAWKDALGYSALLDALFASTMKQWWFENEKQVTVPQLRGRGAEIGKLLASRIDAFCRARNVRLLLVLQGDRRNEDASAVMQHATARGVRTLDLVERFLAEQARDATLHDRWFDGHMTSEGNRWVAEQIAAALRGAGTADTPR